jgi:hypothetical protein
MKNSNQKILIVAIVFLLMACAAPQTVSTPTIAPTLTLLPSATPIPSATPTSSPTPIPTQIGFLTRDGTELTLQGVPFHEISFNKYDLFGQFVLVGGEHEGDDGVPAAIEALQTLHDKGFRVIRINASPYYPAWFNEVFFDDDPQRQAEKRKLFFEGFDQMLLECDKNQIRVVATLIWNIENLADLGHNSLEESFRNPEALGRMRTEEYIREVVSRYKDRPTIAMWEIGNEFNLFADLQDPGGVIPSDHIQSELYPGPVVRDEHNNFTSDDLATFYEDTATLIRSIDQNHLISTGSSSPRPYAMHLLRAARANRPPDWTLDNESELKEYLQMVNPDLIDVISIHYYDEAMTSFGKKNGSPDNLRFFINAADEIGKPLFIGEIGLNSEMQLRYDTQESMDLLNATLPVLVELKVPLTLYWNFNDDISYQKADLIYTLRYGKTDEALKLIEAANNAISE